MYIISGHPRSEGFSQARLTLQLNTSFSKLLKTGGEGTSEKKMENKFDNETGACHSFNVVRGSKKRNKKIPNLR